MAVAARAEPVPIAERHLRRAGWLYLSEAPWWTAADASELEVLVRALVVGVPWHRERCTILDDRGWCRHLTDAVQEVVDWRDAREARSRALWLGKQLEGER